MKYVTLLGLAVLFGCGPKEVSSIEEFNSLVKSVGKKNEEIAEIQKEVMDAVRQYNENRSADSQLVVPDSLLGFGKEQLKLIQNLVSSEQDLTYKGLLNQILDKNEQIEKINAEMTELKAKLPKPYLVAGGDTHYKVARNFLTKEKGLTTEAANTLLDETMLIDELVPGFQVWLYFNDGVFGTFVTQGTARISPNRFKYTIRSQQLEKAKMEGKEEAMREMKSDSGSVVE
jgi:hypothetical protein